MSNKVNEDNIKSLKKIIGDSKKIAAFVGAGASYSLGIKSWEKVLLEMAKEFGAIIDVKQSIEEKGFARTATAIYETKRDKEFYLSFLSKQFEPDRGYHYSLHIKVINAFDIFLTTNYDTSFEAAFEDLNRFLEKQGYPIKELGIQKLPHFDLSEILLKPTVVYLHGNNRDRVYIFKEDEYRHFYPCNYSENSTPSRLENFLRELFTKFTLVFIGFSFNDEDFVKFFKKVLKEEFSKEQEMFTNLYHKQYPLNLPSHFVIISNNELESTISKKDVINIFGEDNNSWEKLFINISNEELMFKSNAKNIIDNLHLNDSKKKEILDKSHKCNENQKRVDFFNTLGIKIISFEGDNYNQIESILLHLQKEEVTAGKNIEEEAANAR